MSFLEFWVVSLTLLFVFAYILYIATKG